MSCDQTAWTESSANYAQSMADLKVKCEEEATAAANVSAAEEALAAAQAALENATAAHESAKSAAALAQYHMVGEADKLGVQCACPEETDPEPTPLGGR